MKQLTVGSIISNAFLLGLKNIVSLVGAVLLWVITFWIPCLNVGTACDYTTENQFGLLYLVNLPLWLQVDRQHSSA